MAEFKPLPDWTESLPDRAETLDHLRGTFYCMNCWRKAPTTYLTPNFGPICRSCYDQIPAFANEALP